MSGMRLSTPRDPRYSIMFISINEQPWVRQGEVLHSPRVSYTASDWRCFCVQPYYVMLFRWCNYSEGSVLYPVFNSTILTCARRIPSEPLDIPDGRCFNPANLD